MADIETLGAPKLPETAESKWRMEQRTFVRLLPQLLGTHKGLYVAIHEGRIVESGLDKLVVAGKAYARCGYMPIYVGLVSETPSPTIHIPSPRVISVEPSR